MLAHTPKKLTFLVAAAITMMAGATFAQQTPSKIYQPTSPRGAYEAPPSAHVPPSAVQQIPMYRKPSFKLPKIDNAAYKKQAYRQQIAPTQAPPRSYDAAPRLGYAQQTINNSRVMRTTYEEDASSKSKGPQVPAILLGNAPQQPQATVPPQTQTQTQPAAPKQSPIAAFQAPPQMDINAFKEDPSKKSPSDFANRMNQVRTDAPVVDAEDFATENTAAVQQAAQAQAAEAEAQAAAEAKALADQIEADRLEQERLALELENQKRIEAQKIAAAQQEAEFQRQLAIRKAAEREETSPVALKAKTGIVTAEATGEMSASEFVSHASGGSTTSPKLKALQEGKALPMVMNLASAEMPIEQEQTQSQTQSQTLRDNNVRPASNETATTDASINLAAPAVQVETYGPSTIGLNKPATYQIVVRNNSSVDAERILVGVNMPEWVELENISLTTGDKEITDGKNQARLVWSVDNVPGNSAQTISITAVPRKPEMFDVGVEWTLVPRIGKTNIRVTEPKLEMNISGPKEVLYGETALYHVTVRNPGTGTAEDVVVMLPEALGGERATLGDITAGKEKNFQVELLARTAGDLNLVATAAADGSLKTSAERALIVRRANLQIALEGPGLKYAGSIAQYRVTITNTGDATATDVVSAVALPTGVKYLGGIDSVKLIEGGMRWPVGSLDPGQTRDYKINCQLDTSGDLQLEVGARGEGELAASSACLTTVETVADLVLTVADPKGPLPTGQEVPYEIKVRNRGSKAAKGINLVMQFSEGIEPRGATGLENKLVPGQVFFNPIPKIDPGEEVTLQITAEAMKSGTHVFRAQLTCQDSDAREVAEGTTRFFGEEIESTTSSSTSTSTANSGGAFDLGTEFKR